MTAFGIDYAYGGPPSAAALHRAGVEFVCRYLAPLPNSKVLTRAEAEALSGDGIWIVVVFEWTATRALAGTAAGVADAKLARRQVQALGMPDGRPIYFAVDFAASSAQIPAIVAYFQGVSSVLGKDGCGVYGGYSVVTAVLDAGVCSWACQTYAWSLGRWDPRAQIRQYSNNHTIGGVSCDYDLAVADDYGQWRVGVAPPDSGEVPVKRILAVGGATDHVVPAGKDNGLPFERTYLDDQKLMTPSGYTCTIKHAGDHLIFARATLNGLKSGDRVHLYVAGMKSTTTPLQVDYEVHGQDFIGDGRDALEIAVSCPDVLRSQPYQVRLRNPNAYDVIVTSARQFRLAQ